MKIETIILAGGESSRMGKDKALLDLDGITFLTHLYKQTQQFSQQVHITTPWHDRYIDLVPQDCNFIKELKPHQGPLSAFAQSLPYVETEWIFLIACDIPLIKMATLKIWQQQLDHLSENTIAFLAKNADRWECLCGFYRSSCSQSAMKYLQTGKKSFQRWLQTVEVATINQDDDRFFYNCNTPEEYQRLRSL